MKTKTKIETEKMNKIILYYVMNTRHAIVSRVLRRYEIYDNFVGRMKEK